MKKYISRPLYIKKIAPYFKTDLIKVLIGQRRSGKSYLLFEIIDTLKKKFKIPSKNIIYINKELQEFKDIIDDESLAAHLKKFSQIKGPKVLLIDEVQEILNFEKILRSLQSKGGWDIYISGSNANILSSELSTFLSGRYIEIEIFPLSYKEFLKFHKLEKTEESFNKYIRYGGLPYLKHLPLEDEVIYGYLKGVFDSILLKDVVKRYKIRNVSFLQNLTYYLANNIGSLVSAKSISDYLRNEKINLTPNLILDYLQYINSVYLILGVKRKEIGKKIFQIGAKHYFTDLGIRHSIFSYGIQDIGKILENLVYIHLRRHGYNVFIGSNQGKEIDFIAEKNGNKKYFQVAYLLKDQKTINREFGNLLAIPNNFEKSVISMDQSFNDNYKGIKTLNAMDFLANNI